MSSYRIGNRPPELFLPDLGKSITITLRVKGVKRFNARLAVFNALLKIIAPICPLGVVVELVKESADAPR